MNTPQLTHMFSIVANPFVSTKLTLSGPDQEPQFFEFVEEPMTMFQIARTRKDEIFIRAIIGAGFGWVLAAPTIGFAATIGLGASPLCSLPYRATAVQLKEFDFNSSHNKILQLPISKDMHDTILGKLKEDKLYWGNRWVTDETGVALNFISDLGLLKLNLVERFMKMSAEFRHWVEEIQNHETELPWLPPKLSKYGQWELYTPPPKLQP